MIRRRSQAGQLMAKEHTGQTYFIGKRKRPLRGFPRRLAAAPT
jgi:hypothetical protein